MKNLKGLKFKAKSWHDSTNIVEGDLALIDHKTLSEPAPKVNRNGYLVVIVNNGVKHIVDPDSIELLEELSEELQTCEGCAGKWSYDKMKSDSDGVPLCENCFDALQREVSTWVCKICKRKSIDFGEEEVWVGDDICSTCDEKSI